MATRRAWQDRGRIISALEMAKLSISTLYSNFESLKETKIEILDDPARKAELIVLLNEDPDYSAEIITAAYIKLKTIYDWAKANGY